MRFAPSHDGKSSGFLKCLTECNTPPDLLIATDCISEGQNLQDGDYLVNYDIHGNPVRIIQRFGRFERFGRIELPGYLREHSGKLVAMPRGRTPSRPAPMLTTRSNRAPSSACVQWGRCRTGRHRDWLPVRPALRSPQQQ